MSDEALKDFLEDLVETTIWHIKDNELAYMNTERDYFMGRFYESQDMRRDLQKLMQKHGIKIKIDLM